LQHGLLLKRRPAQRERRGRRGRARATTRSRLRLKGEGLVPLYGWGVQIEPDPGPARDLGTLQLRRGSSVSGWVTTEAVLPPKVGGRVELTPERSGRREGGDRAAVMTLDTRSNEPGFFQFEGVAPGSYVVRLAVPDYAPARRAPVVVHEGMESELLEPLVLARPATLAVLGAIGGFITWLGGLF
jgi:hypothetical protein